MTGESRVASVTSISPLNREAARPVHRAADPRVAQLRAQMRKDRADRKWIREQRLYDTVLSPNMIRLAMVAGIIAYSTYEARSSTNVGPVRSALAFALPGIGIPLIAADAGIKDWRALAAISAAGIGYTTGQMGIGWLEAMTGEKIGLPNPWTWFKNIGGPGWLPWD